MRPEIYTPKISKRFETVYYYKQKFVNWEFSAPSGYTSIVTVPDIESVSKEFVNVVAIKSELYPFKLKLYKYATESSYIAHDVFYEITAINTVPYDNIETINSIICDNEDIPIFIQNNDVLTTQKPQIKYTQLIYGDSALSLFSKNTYFTSNITFDKYGAYFNREIKQKFETYSPINLHADILIIPKLEANKGHYKTAVKTACLSSKSYLQFSNANLTIINNTYKEKSGQITDKSIILSDVNLYPNSVVYRSRFDDNVTISYRDIPNKLVMRAITMAFNTAGTLN